MIFEILNSWILRLSELKMFRMRTHAGEDKKILNSIQSQLPSNAINWLHEQDFGDGFQLENVFTMESYLKSNSGAHAEFLDKKLEKLRSNLNRAIRNFIGYVSDYAVWDFNMNMGKIPRNLEEKLFENRRKQINDTAEDIYCKYNELIRIAKNGLL